MLLATFLLNLAAGLYLFLPLVGRRHAGVKFYRLIIAIAAALAAGALAAHWLAGRMEFVRLDAVVVALSVAVVFLLRYPKRLVFRASAALLGAAYLVAALGSYHASIRPQHLGWSIAGALSAMAILGSINLAMLLGHWYLVVRGMAIDPLKRLAIATLVTTLVRIAVVFSALIAGGHESMAREIFFWMRAGWGLLGPVALYPMVWGTVKIRSTMAATGILYVDVVAVVIGEVLGVWLASRVNLPV